MSHWQATIPDELISRVLENLSPCEIVHLRLVSKRFNSITRDTALWRTLYTTARLPRPPGPFLWQSTSYLERILVRSERLERTWTSQPFNVVAHIKGPRIPRHKDSLWSSRSIDSDSLFGGLFFYHDDVSIFCHDLETGTSQVVWCGDLKVLSIRVRPLSTSNGLRLVLAAHGFWDPQQGPQIKPLVYSINDDTSLPLGSLVYEINLPQSVNFPFRSNSNLFYFAAKEQLTLSFDEIPTVIDPRTCALYRFLSPHFDSEDEGLRVQVWLSGTYILSRWDTMHRGRLIRVYVIPDEQHPIGAVIGELCITHEAELDFMGSLIQALRGPVVDPVTGDTTLRFLARHADLKHGVHRTHYLYIDFKFPAGDLTSTEVLSLSVESQEIFVIDGVPKFIAFEGSDDGYVRGLIISRPIHLEAQQFLHYKCSIDASGETCTAVLSPAAPRSDLLFSGFRVFDRVRGRIGYEILKEDFLCFEALDFE